MHHRLAPVQASPDARVVHFTHERVETVVGPFCLNQLRNHGTAGCQSPCDLVGAEEAPDGIRVGVKRAAKLQCLSDCFAMTRGASQITRLLKAWSGGHEAALKE